MIDDKMLNATISFSHAYFAPDASERSAPEFVQLKVTGRPTQKWEEEFCLPLCDVSIKALRKRCSFLQCDMTERSANKLLMDELQTQLQGGELVKGYYFRESGAISFPDGRLAFLHGKEMYPSSRQAPYITAPEIRNLELAGNNSLPHMFIAELMSAPPQALLTIGFVIQTSVRSVVLHEGSPNRSILYIMGGQGLGKTTLASRLAGIYRDSSSDLPATNIVQAGSSIAAIESLLLIHRDQPVIVDDLCFSAGKDTERKRRELGAKLIREGTGESPIIKKCGKEIKSLQCKAGVILTAEFSMENLSDLTRCLIVPVNQGLHLSSMLTPELVGDMLRHYSCWFAANSNQELKRLQESLNGKWRQDLEPRVRANYGCLRWACKSLVRSLSDLGLRSNTRKELLAKMDDAIELAITEHKKLTNAILDQMPIGNLAACIYSGYREGAFDLTKKIEKLQKHEGILWKKDLCLRPEALGRFVRLQPGFKNWSRNRISRELKDLGALVLQEEGTSTVHLAEDSPRVYRIQLDVVKDAAEYYNKAKQEATI